MVKDKPAKTTKTSKASSKPRARRREESAVAAVENKIITLVARGFSNREIAAELNMTRENVGKTLRRMHGRLAAENEAMTATHFAGLAERLMWQASELINRWGVNHDPKYMAELTKVNEAYARLLGLNRQHDVTVVIAQFNRQAQVLGEAVARIVDDPVKLEQIAQIIEAEVITDGSEGK